MAGVLTRLENGDDPNKVVGVRSPRPPHRTTRGCEQTFVSIIQPT